MTKFITLGLILFLSLNAGADNIACVDLFGSANKDIVRFGGLRPRTPIQEMANLMLSYVPRDAGGEVQVGVPIVLESTVRQGEQFGDGQRNAFASYGALPKAPFVAVLSRGTKFSDPAELAVALLEGMPGLNQVSQLEISILGVTQTVDIDKNGVVRLPVDVQSLGWDQIYDAKISFL